MRAIAIAALSIITVCGCSSSQSSGASGDLAVHAPLDLRSTGDGPPAPPDLSAAPDLSVVNDLATTADLRKPVDLAGADLAMPMQGGNAMVMCGKNTICMKPMAICCSPDHGMTGMCVAAAGMCGNGIPYYCDDPSDCAMGQVCCLGGQNAQCMAAADCANINGLRMCASKNDCAATENCCGFTPFGGGFGKCQMGPCPICNTKWTAFRALREKAALARVEHKAR
jgi:hypothetical protein